MHSTAGINSSTRRRSTGGGLAEERVDFALKANRDDVIVGTYAAR
jgi:hypothetical protein